jgi:hypothetical protein
VHGGAVTGADLCCTFNAAIHGQRAPRHLSTDHDPLLVSKWESSRRIQDSATLRGTRRLAYADSRMRNFLLALLRLAVTIAKLCGPGGVRAVIAENLLAPAAASSAIRALVSTMTTANPL